MYELLSHVLDIYIITSSHKSQDLLWKSEQKDYKSQRLTETKIYHISQVVGFSVTEYISHIGLKLTIPFL